MYITKSYYLPFMWSLVTVIGILGVRESFLVLVCP